MFLRFLRIFLSGTNNFFNLYPYLFRSLLYIKQAYFAAVLTVMFAISEFIKTE